MPLSPLQSSEYRSFSSVLLQSRPISPTMSLNKSIKSSFSLKEKKSRIFSLLHVINNMLPLITWRQNQFHAFKSIMWSIKSIKMAPEPKWPVINNHVNFLYHAAFCSYNLLQVFVAIAYHMSSIYMYQFLLECKMSVAISVVLINHYVAIIYHMSIDFYEPDICGMQ